MLYLPHTKSPPHTHTHSHSHPLSQPARMPTHSHTHMRTPIHTCKCIQTPPHRNAHSEAFFKMNRRWPAGCPGSKPTGADVVQLDEDEKDKYMDV